MNVMWNTHFHLDFDMTLRSGLMLNMHLSEVQLRLMGIQVFVFVVYSNPYYVNYIFNFL